MRERESEGEREDGGEGDRGMVNDTYLHRERRQRGESEGERAGRREGEGDRNMVNDIYIQREREERKWRRESARMLAYRGINSNVNNA